MFSETEATKERVDAYLAALQAEKGQLKQALKQEKAAGNAERLERLGERMKANAAEIARVKKLGGEAPAEAEPEAEAEAA